MGGPWSTAVLATANRMQVAPRTTANAFRVQNYATATRHSGPLSILLPGPSPSRPSLNTARHPFYHSSLRAALPPTSISRPFSALLTPTRTTISKNQKMLAQAQSRLPFRRAASSQNHLANLEQMANNSPTSAAAQNAFYSAVMRAGMPQVVVERYQTGRFASNDACDQVYERALGQVVQAEGGAVTGASSGSANMNSGQLSQNVASAIAARAKGSGRMAGWARLGSKGTGEKSSPLHVVVSESWAEILFKWVRFVVWVLVLGYVGLFCLTLLMETSGALRRVATNGNLDLQPQQPTTRFSDVQGCEEAKEEVRELVEFLKNPQQFNKLGGKLPKGVLMTGPPGTGKTLLARAVAGEAGVPFFYMSGSEFDEMYVGVGAKRVRELFEVARQKAPAIIFIDELDAIGAKRNDRDPTYVKQSLNQLLTELDGFAQDTGVIIMGATNLPKLLDPALTRPGRFDRRVVFELPDVRGRMAILDYYFKKIKIDPDVDSSIIARKTTGMSGAQLEDLVNQAAVRASRDRKAFVKFEDIDFAFDKIVLGAERRSLVVRDEDKLITAYHEAGHALVCLYHRGKIPLYKVTIVPRGPALGLTHFIEPMDQTHRPRKQMEGDIATSMGGKIAEALVFGDDETSSGCSGDLEGATNMAFHMVLSAGMSERVGPMALGELYGKDVLSAGTKALVESEVRVMLQQGQDEARQILTDKRKELDLLAYALMEYEELTGDEVEKLLKGEKIEKPRIIPKAPIVIPDMTLPRPATAADTPPSSAGAGSQFGR